MNYESANAKLQGRNKESRKIDNNTYLRRCGEDITVRLHSTDIVTFKPNGDTILDSGGWLTPTTKDRMNQLIPFLIYSENRVWYLRNHSTRIKYADGMIIHPDGSVTGVVFALTALVVANP